MGASAATWHNSDGDESVDCWFGPTCWVAYMLKYDKQVGFGSGSNHSSHRFISWDVQ